MLEFSSAGHEPPFVRTPRGAPQRFAIAGGPPLCVVEDFVYSSSRRRLEPGEWICVVTDGATEAMNERREFFGVERLHQRDLALDRRRTPRAGRGDRAVRDDVRRFGGESRTPRTTSRCWCLWWKGFGFVFAGGTGRCRLRAPRDVKPSLIVDHDSLSGRPRQGISTRLEGCGARISTLAVVVRRHQELALAAPRGLDPLRGNAEGDHHLAQALGAREREPVVEGKSAHGIGVPDHHDVGAGGA